MSVLVGPPADIVGVCRRCTAHPGWHRHVAGPSAVVRLSAPADPARAGDILDDILLDHFLLIEGRARPPATPREHMIRSLAYGLRAAQLADREGWPHA